MRRTPFPLYQRPRGYGGVALAWSKNLSQFAKKIPDGSERIIPVLFESEYDKVCVISVYLPWQGSYSEATYQDSLDILSTVIWKYKNSHTIVILGDCNASLFDQRGSRDSKFSRCCRDHNVVPHASYPKTGTHLHHRGSGQSTIDYILCTNPDIISNVSVGQCHPTFVIPCRPRIVSPSWTGVNVILVFTRTLSVTSSTLLHLWKIYHPCLPSVIPLLTS